jgi:hypothetical protein
MTKLTSCLLSLAFLFLVNEAFGVKLSKKVSILTIAPGTDLYALFGHNAIRVQDLITGDDMTYNYGTFDFDTPNFAIKFMRGKLPYALTKAPMQNFLYEYNQTKRGVIEQELVLDSAQTMKIIDLLETNALPENRLYMYDFLFDNCATRVRDIIEASSASPIKYDESNFTPKTYRNQLHEYLENYPWTKFGIDLIVASPADGNTDMRTQMFLPDYLNSHFSTSRIQKDSSNLLLAKPSKEVLFFESDEQFGSIFTPRNFFGLLAVLLLGFYFLPLTKDFVIGAAQTWFVVLGIASLLIIFMWFGTDHKTTKDNFNLIWISPVYMFLPFVGRKLSIVLGSVIALFTIASCFVSLPQAMPIMTVLPLLLVALAIYIYHQARLKPTL